MKKFFVLVCLALFMNGCAALENPATKSIAEKVIDWLVDSWLSCKDEPQQEETLPEPIECEE